MKCAYIYVVSYSVLEIGDLSLNDEGIKQCVCIREVREGLA